MKRIQVLIAGMVLLGGLAAPAPAQAQAVTFNIQGGVVDTLGGAILFGTISPCPDDGSEWSVFTALRQRGPTFNGSASFDFGECDGGAQTWSTTHHGVGPYHPGPAMAEGDGAVCRPGDPICDEDTEELKRIHLRKQ